MLVNIDELLGKMDGWNLALTIGGNQFIVDAPSPDAAEKLKSILSGEAIAGNVRPELENLIAPLIREPTVDVKRWELDELVGAATAIVVHLQEIRNAQSRSIVRLVARAMRPGQAANVASTSDTHPASQTPNAAAAPFCDAPASVQAVGINAPVLTPEARRIIQDFIKLRIGVAVPPGTPDADLNALAVRATHPPFRLGGQIRPDRSKRHEPDRYESTSNRACRTRPGMVLAPCGLAEIDRRSPASDRPEMGDGNGDRPHRRTPGIRNHVGIRFSNGVRFAADANQREDTSPLAVILPRRRRVWPYRFALDQEQAECVLALHPDAGSDL